MAEADYARLRPGALGIAALVPQKRGRGRPKGSIDTKPRKTYELKAARVATCSCGAQFAARAVHQRCCSRACQVREANRAKRLDGRDGDRKRASYYGCHYEHVNPASVFERDGWRCYLCGVDTPKELRGTREPNAPELDHVIPLAKGGAHSYQNTRCACKRCNRSKGARTAEEALALA